MLTKSRSPATTTWRLFVTSGTVWMIKLPHSLHMLSSVLVLTMLTLFSSVPPTMSSINFSAFRTLSPELSSSLIAKPSRSLFFDSCIGYLSKAEFDSSLPPLHTKPFPPTPRNTLLHLSTITNPSVLLLLWPALSPPDSIQHQLWFSLISLLCSCHLELNSSRNPLIANHWCLQTRPKNSLLLLPPCLDHLLPIHQIQFILIILIYIYTTFITFDRITRISGDVYRNHNWGQCRASLLRHFLLFFWHVFISKLKILVTLHCQLINFL